MTPELWMAAVGNYKVEIDYMNMQDWIILLSHSEQPLQ